jgi:hypothetical protein
VCGGGGSGWGGSRPAALSCCTADAGVCVSGGTRCCPRDRVCGDACCSQGESCSVDANGAAQCRSALPRPLQAGDGGAADSRRKTAILSSRESGSNGGSALVFDDGRGSGGQQDAAAERRWRSAGYQEDPCGRATAVLTATRLVGGTRLGLVSGPAVVPGSTALGEARATATVRTCCELCATTPGCGHFSFDGDSMGCILKAAGTPAVARRLASDSPSSAAAGGGQAGPVFASSQQQQQAVRSFARDGGSSSSSFGGAAGLLWAVPSRAFVSGTLAYAPSPEMCPQSRLCSAAGNGSGGPRNDAAACCPGPVGPGKPWTCSPQGMCVEAGSGGKQQQQQPQPSVAAALLAPPAAARQQQQQKQQPMTPGSVVNYAAATRMASGASSAAGAFLVQDPNDPQACLARAQDAAYNPAAAASSPFAFRSDTMIAPRSGGALNRDRPTVAATAKACCKQCAGVSNCAHFSWDSSALACSLYSDRAGADGAAKATRLEVPRRGSVAGSMIPRLALASADGGAAAAAADAAAARCASPCGDNGLCCDAKTEACLEPTGLSGFGGAEHSCCPRDNVCGKRCGCDVGDQCVAGNCCPAERACGNGNKCCPPSDRCNADGQCVRDNGGGGGSGGGGGDSNGFRVITGSGTGGAFNRGFNTNAGYGTQFAAVQLPAGGR